MNKMTSDQTALICGISGQDGAWLARLLLDKGYRVVGTARDAQISHFGNLDYLGIRERVGTMSRSLTDFRSVIQVLDRVRPDEVYNLAGQSSVGLSLATGGDAGKSCYRHAEPAGSHPLHESAHAVVQRLLGRMFW